MIRPGDKQVFADLPRYFRRDDGRTCIMAPAAMPMNDDADAPPAGGHYNLRLSMLCGGSSHRTREIDSGPATCLGCMAEYESYVEEDSDHG